MGGKLTDETMFAWVLAHPIRCRALTIFAAREASPVEIGLELGIGASHVAYHVRILLKANLIAIVEEVPQRGSIEHRYVAIDSQRLTDEQYSELTPEERARRVYNTLCFAVADANCALSSGRFEQSHHLNRIPMQIDRVGWSEVLDLCNFMQGELFRIQEVCRDRMDGTGATSIPALVFSTFFELPSEHRRHGASGPPAGAP
jgi:DNA-binding transcriptional ArsR family regulator